MEQIKTTLQLKLSGTALLQMLHGDSNYLNNFNKNAKNDFNYDPAEVLAEFLFSFYISSHL